MEIYKANQQWSNRPDDERFNSLEELHAATRAYYETAREKLVPFSEIRVEANSGDVQLVGKAGIPAKLTHWAFGQLSNHIGAPASYLRELPATLAAQNLNYGLAERTKQNGQGDKANLLFHLPQTENAALVLRALTTDSYSRIWNYEVAERLLGLQAMEWEVARPDIRQQDDKLPLYASDHDMFAFLRNSNLTISERGSDGAVYRGVIVENSEVGASALKLTRFLYREMCGNHIIWGASELMEFSIRHIGDARQRWGKFVGQIRQYANEGASDMEAKIVSAKTRVIGGNKEKVLDAIFGKRVIGLSRKVLSAGYEAVKPLEDGNPNSAWGIVQGLTRYSQTLPYADQRTAIDRAAGKILEANF